MKTLRFPAYTEIRSELLVCALLSTVHGTMHLTFYSGKHICSPRSQWEWILMWGKGTWGKTQTGNPHGQVGASSGLTSTPTPLLCPPSALGLPIQEQKGHLVFVWDSSQDVLCLWVCQQSCLYECLCVCNRLWATCLNSHLSVKANKLQVSYKCVRTEHTVDLPRGITVQQLVLSVFTPTGWLHSLGVLVMRDPGVSMMRVYT